MVVYDNSLKDVGQLKLMVWPADGAFLCGYVVTRVRPLMWRHATIIASLFSQNFPCCSVFNRYLEQFSAVPSIKKGAYLVYAIEQV